MILKPSFYDEFHCIGGECSYTCCMDWKITLDREETKRHLYADGYLNEEPLNLLPDGTSSLRFRDDDKRCRFLTGDGFCRLVLEHGEEFICHTCHVFPRFESEYVTEAGDTGEMDEPNASAFTKELHLSNACPSVLHFFLQLSSPMGFIAEDVSPDLDAFSKKTAYYIPSDMLSLRERCIDLMQYNELSVGHRLFLLRRFSGEYNIHRDPVRAAADMADAKKILKLYRTLKGTSIPAQKTLVMLHQVIRDIGCYKNKTGSYQTYIKRIEPLIDRLLSPSDHVIEKWEEYKALLVNYNTFFEHFLVNYLFTHTENLTAPDNFDISVRTMILEYIMIRGVLFLIYMENGGELSDTEIKNVSAFYARMYEHGLAGTEGFVKGNLDNPWFSEGGMLAMLS